MIVTVPKYMVNNGNTVSVLETVLPNRMLEDFVNLSQFRRMVMPSAHRRKNHHQNG